VLVGTGACVVHGVSGMSLNSEGLTNNAFRVLGLSATASQSAIEQAARRMRIWPDPARVPPTPWDLPWLGPGQRTTMNPPHAGSRLNDPLARIRERLMWFHEPLSLTSSAPVDALEATLERVRARTDPAAGHDAALARFAAAMLADP